VTVAACGSDDVAAPPPAAAPADVNATDDADFARAAHGAALERFTKAGAEALALADPVANAALGHGPLAAPPLSRASRAVVRMAVDAALLEGRGIERKSLSPQDGMRRDLMSIGLQTVRRDLNDRPEFRRDPTAFATRANALLDVIQARLRRGLPCDRCAQAIDDLGKELALSPGQLGATSAASLAAALEDLDALTQRLTATEALSGERERKETPATWAKAIASAHEGTAAIASRLQSIAPVLPDARTGTWEGPVAGGVAADAVQRLPDRLGSKELDRRLTDDESVSFTGASLSTEIALLLTRLSRMRDRLPAANGDTAAATPVTVERCQAAWAPLAAWAKDNPVLAGAAFDCAAGGAALAMPATDAELVLRLFDHGVVLPSRATRRKEVPAALGLPSARMASAGNTLALSVSGLIAAERPAAARLAIARAQQQLCVALAATVEHGELGEPAGRAERLAQSCPDAVPADLVHEALARPREALAAAGMVLISRGPAEAAALSLFWWAPLGLVGPLADPARAAQADPSTLPTPSVEALRPAAESGGSDGAGAP